jgi:hypothetical protein
MKCWRIRYYFQHGTKHRLLRGEICGCVGGDTKAAAIAAVSPIVPGEGEKDVKAYRLVKITATPSRKGHYCFANEASR